MSIYAKVSVLWALWWLDGPVSACKSFCFWGHRSGRRGKEVHKRKFKFGMHYGGRRGQ